MSDDRTDTEKLAALPPADRLALRGAFETAEGIASLAALDRDAAAPHFEAARLYLDAARIAGDGTVAGACAGMLADLP